MPVSSGSGGGGGTTGNSENKYGNTYGLSTQFLESLGISGPLVTRVFVANVSYIFIVLFMVFLCDVHNIN